MDFIKCLFFISLLFLISCEPDTPKANSDINPGDLKKEVLKDVEILYSDSAVVRVKISGKELVRTTLDQDTKEEFTNGVLVNFFDANGITTSTLRADYAIRYQNKNEVLARNNVVLTSNKKETMESDELIWDRQKEKVYTEKFVMVKTADERVWGHGFSSNQDFTAWQITGFEGKIKSEKISGQ